MKNTILKGLCVCLAVWILIKGYQLGNAFVDIAIGEDDPIFVQDLFVNTLGFNGTTSGTVTMRGQAAAGTWTLQLPTTAGSASQFLQTDGTGVTTWATPAGGGGADTKQAALHSFGRATLTNIPAGCCTEPSRASGGAYGRGKVDMTDYIDVRLSADHILVQCSPDGDIFVQYSTNQSTWLTLIGDSASEALDCTTALGAKVSPWVSIVAGAKADVFVRVVSAAGDGMDDPQFTAMTLHVR